MKKDLLFSAALLIVVLLLFMLGVTGMTAHIAVSVIGLLMLIVYTVMTKKTWKSPVLEILERVFYAVSLITGIVLMNVHGIALVSILHKLGAVLFVIFLIVTQIHKNIKR